MADSLHLLRWRLEPLPLPEEPTPFLMPEHDKTRYPASRGDTPGGGSRSSLSARFEQFEKRQHELWRLTIVILLALVFGFAWMSWDFVRTLARQYQVLPIGAVVLVLLFVSYMWRKTREISEMRGLMRGIERRDDAPPSEKQLDQLFEMISRSQQGYRDLIDSFDDLLLAFTLDGQIRAVNRSFSDLVGEPFQQIIGKPISEFVQEGGGKAQELIALAMPRFLDRRSWAGVIEIRLKNSDSLYYFDCTAHAVVRNDEIMGITILARDITALRKNEARFTELFETLQEGIYIVTPEGNILDANPALVRMLGYDSKEELLNKTVPEIFPERATRKSIKEEVDRRSMLEGREITLLRKDGAPIICLNTAAAVRDATGKPVRYQGSLMDMSHRREIERRLHQQQEFARRLVDNFPDLILVLDTSSNYTFVGPRSKEILGYEPGEIQTMDFGHCSHPEDIPAIKTLFDDIVAHRQNFASLEIRVRHKLGEWRRIRFNFSPLFDEAGEIEGVVLSGRDVTDLKRLEEQLIQAEKLAAMGQMLAGVAHELNNPLTAILGVTELLREKDGVEENTKRQLDLTHRQARRAARIVQNLLEFSRPASPQKRPLDLNSIVERTLQLHEHSLRRNNIEVDFRPKSGLPAVIGDANQLIQVLLNLVTNAEQAIREVRESGRIQILITRTANRISVTVQDDGVGVKPEALPRIFDPFYTTKRPGGGTGLGLSICMSIIREHGGTIEANALPAGGSAFTVYLPASSEIPASSAVHDTGGLEAKLPVLGKDSWTGRVVLVLDDEESICMLLEEGLSAQGLAVDCAATAEEAIDLAASRSYDALLCDLNLSSGGFAVSGRDAAERILAATGPHKPSVIFMTGDFVESSKSDSLSGEPLLLQKPFRISEVLSLLKQSFSSNGATLPK